MGGDRVLKRLLLVGTDDELLESWNHEFTAWPSAVHVVDQSIDRSLDRVDAVISPGNSYGDMNGGVDLVLSSRFPQVQKAVWQRIAERHHGYQPVGTAEVILTGDPNCPWLVYAPTMRVPMPLDHGKDIAVHDAFWAALLAIETHNLNQPPDQRIDSVASPGFGTGYGRVVPRRAAELMATAYRFWLGPSKASASEREHLLAD